MTLCGHTSFLTADVSTGAGDRLNTYLGGRARPSAIINPSFHMAWRQLQPNDDLSNSPVINTKLLDPAPVLVTNLSGTSQLELSTHRDRISYPLRKTRTSVRGVLML